MKMVSWWRRVDVGRQMKSSSNHLQSFYIESESRKTIIVCMFDILDIPTFKENNSFLACSNSGTVIQNT